MNKETWKQFRRRVRSEILCPLFRLAIFSAKVLPWSWTRAICSGLGRLAYVLIRRDRQRTITHLAMAYGHERSKREIHTMARDNFRNLGRNFADFMISQSFNTKEDIAQLVSVEGAEHVANALAKGKGLIIITCHLSVFELILSWCCLRYPISVVGARMDDKKLNDLLIKHRTRLGATNIYKGEANLKLFRVLKQGNILGLLIDQDTSVKSVFVDFFGQPAATPVGAALLAQRTDASVLVTAIRRVGSKQHLTFNPEIELIRTDDSEADLQANTQEFTRQLEDFIREAPTQWVWMHRRWRTKSPEEDSKPL